jgi:hypothetical protein
MGILMKLDGIRVNYLGPISLPHTIPPPDLRHPVGHFDKLGPVVDTLGSRLGAMLVGPLGRPLGIRGAICSM